MNYLLKNGYKLNPNAKLVEAITKRIEICNGYCPCDNPDKGTEDAEKLNLCPKTAGVSFIFAL